MIHTDSRLHEDWQATVDRPGGTEHLARTANETGAFRRARGVRSPVGLLRLVPAYCLGKQGLRLTEAWAAAVGVADISNVALLWRLKRCAGHHRKRATPSRKTL